MIMRDFSAVIVAGGWSKRFGRSKVSVDFLGKPLIRHVIDKTTPLVDEVLIVLRDDAQREEVSAFNLSPSIRLITDEVEDNSPMIGALSGFNHAKGEYTMLLACDTPLISVDVLLHLMKIAPKYDCVIPRWPNGYIEPLQAVYRTEQAYQSARKALNEGGRRMQNMISYISHPFYLSTDALREFDPNLYTFQNINTPDEFERIERLLR
jgi:molybdopterin-guanine dinucleotide biosynthesis protein A